MGHTLEREMTTALNSMETQESLSSIEMGEGDWFVASIGELRNRTAREGSWVSRPSREIVERLIDWLRDENSQPRL
jgi:hypothetical protein